MWFKFIGFFGFFEVIEDYEVAELLLDCAGRWLSERGMTVMRGPGQYSAATHERQGILIDGFDSTPTVELTHNPPYYAQFLERYGFQKAKDYLAYMFNRDNIQVSILKKQWPVTSNLRMRNENILKRGAEFNNREPKKSI